MQRVKDNAVVLSRPVFFDVVVLFHLLAIADKIYGNHCAPWSVEILIKYALA